MKKNKVLFILLIIISNFVFGQNGCDPPPIANAGNDQTICGTPANITVTGGDSCFWSNGEKTTTITVFPTITTTYTVTITSNGCTASDDVKKLSSSC